MLDSAMLQAEQTLQQATNNHYEIGVPTGGMISSVRQSLALCFVEKLVEALSRGERYEQIQLKVVEGVQERRPQPLPPAFSCSTQVKNLSKGAGGRYVFAGTPAQMAKKGPVSQQLTSTVLAPNMPGPVNLKLVVRWNQFYKTATNNAVPQHTISGVQQTQIGRNNFVWLHSLLAKDSNIGLDCQICIQNLHECLDGVKPVESLNPEGFWIAIKKHKQLVHEELLQIDSRLQLPPPATIQVACQVDHSIVLHQLTVDRFDSIAQGAQKLSIAELQRIVRQAAASQQAALQHQLHPQGPPSLPHMQASTSQSRHMQHNILSSRVVDDMHHSAHATASASNRDRTSEGPFTFVSLKHLVDQNFQWVKTRLDVVHGHLMAHGETLDDITDHIHNIPPASQQAPQQQQSKTEQGNAAPTSSQGMPAASSASVAMMHPPQSPDPAEMDEPLQHLLAALEPPQSADVMTVASEDELDTLSAEAPEPAVLAPPVLPMPPPPPPSMQPWLHDIAQPREPFYSISAANLRKAILEGMHDTPQLNAEEISCTVWPPPVAAPDMNRKFMRSKINNILYVLERAGLVECHSQADASRPRWSLI